MSKSKKGFAILITSALAVAAVFGVFAYRSVSAQSATPTAPSGQAQSAQPFFGRGGHDGLRGGVSDQELATALGITTDQLAAAEQAASTEALKQAVSKGLITQQQADQMSANGFKGHRFGGADGIDYNALLASALGITPAQLQAAQQKAFTAAVDSAVASGNITQAQADLMKARNALQNDSKFQASMQSAYESAVKQAVTDGLITQAQADAILAQQGQWGMGGGPGFGGRGHGGPGGFPPDFNGGSNNNPNNQNNQAAPTPNGL